MTDIPTPPAAPIRPTIHTTHGDARVDEYAWLRDAEDPETIAYLEAENAYMKQVLAPTDELQETLYREMVSRIQETDVSVPERIGEWEYYTRTYEGKQYPVLCRRSAGGTSSRGREAPVAIGSPDEQIILDENALAEGHEYFRVGAATVSPDHRMLAYAVDTSGSERYVVHILDLETGLQLPERMENVSANLEWAEDSRTLFYVVLTASHRPAHLYRHAVGTLTDDDHLVHFEEDEGFFLGISKTRSREYLVVEMSSHATSEARVIPAQDPAAEPVVVLPRRKGVEYTVAHHGEHFYILSNEDALNFALWRTPVTRLDRAEWEPVLPHRDDTKLDGVDAFRNHMAVWERRGGLEHLRILPLGGEGRLGGPGRPDDHYVEFAEPVYAIGRGGNPEFDTTELRFIYTSPVTPSQVIDYDMATRARIVQKEQPVLGGYDRTLYRAERLYVAARDGARIPVSLVYRLPFERNGSRPMLLQGYGAYGISSDMGFSSARLSLLDRGIVVAVAHVRGGEENGRHWYESGKLFNKTNTFTDFVAAAEQLVSDGYTSSDRLAIMGGSAGGLLMGAVVNLRPELFRAVVADVPFVDVVNTMLDPSLPLTVIEYDEWGDPNDPEVYRYILRYSPYENVSPQPYPAMLVTGGLNDPRVGFWEPAKWVAKLRTMNSGDRPILLKTNMGAGHAGASGRYDYLREVALEYGFVISEITE